MGVAAAQFLVYPLGRKNSPMNVHTYARQILCAILTILFLAGCGAVEPLTASPPPSDTPAVSITETWTPTAATSPISTFTGSVQVEGGSCCIGGTMGDTVQVHVQLSAASPFGSVTRMRVKPTGGCGAQPDMDLAAWEPFAPEKVFPVQVALNWVGFYVSAQFEDDKGNLSPVYCDDISVEGMPAPILVNPTEWYPQIQCFSESDVHPGPGVTVSGLEVTFSWPGTNNLPEGVFYRVSAFSSVDHYTGPAASGQTRDTSITLPIPADRAGDIVWYITLADANGNLLDHGRCSSFAASLLTVEPAEGIKGVHFTYRP